MLMWFQNDEYKVQKNSISLKQKAYVTLYKSVTFEQLKQFLYKSLIYLSRKWVSKFISKIM